MKITIKSQSPQWLLAAGLVLGVASVNAANGFTVTRAQEQQVTAGMTADEVRQVIGSPVRVEKYGNEPGPTWIYNVAGASPLGPNPTAFYVDFAADGKVASVSELEIPGSDED